MNAAAQPAPNADAASDSIQWIEIFRSGTHTDMHGRKMEFSDAWLQGVADRYDPKRSEAPVVVGHPSTNLPAYGWVAQLKFEDGALWYAEHQSEAQFVDMRREGRFKKRSASFFLPDAPNNPTPGEPYLRHVGWLGAAAPAIKGLKDVDFSDHGVGVIEFEDGGVGRWNWRTLSNLFTRMREDMIERDGVEKADRIIPRYEIDALYEAGLMPDRGSTRSGLYADAITDTHTDLAATPAAASDHAHADLEDSAMTDQKATEFAERETQLSARDKELQDREKTLRDKEAKAARDAAGDYADGLVDAGKLLPAQKAPVVELLLAFAGDSKATLSFADGDEKIEKPADEVLRNFLDSLPRQVDYAEKSGNRGDDTHNISFAAPAGTLVDPEQLAIHAKAKVYQQAHPTVSFVDAVKAVGG